MEDGGFAGALDVFVAMLKRARAIRPDFGLVSAVSLGSHEISGSGENFATAASRVGGRSLENWRYIQSRRNVAQISTSQIVNRPPLDREVFFDEKVCGGLAYASYLGELGVSFGNRPPWDASVLPVNIARVVETDDEINIIEEVASIRHAATASHLNVHHDFLISLGSDGVRTGPDLWATVGARFPHLEFLPSVQRNLHGIRPDAVEHIDERLSELELVTSRWNPAETEEPSWRSKVTADSESRKHFSEFTDTDGIVRSFHMHARFTPGAGRIHFRCLPSGDNGRLRVAYIGGKLGT